MKRRSLLISTVFLFITSGLTAQITDKDGNTYRTVKIGTQEWMAEDLNVTHFRNGDPIGVLLDSVGWFQDGYDSVPLCAFLPVIDPQLFGIGTTSTQYFYNWYAINDPRGLAPDGWHIPSTADWTILIDYLGGNGVAGGKMKSTKGWDYDEDKNGNGTDESGFNAYPWGAYKGGFIGLGDISGWWSSTDNINGNGWAQFLENSDDSTNKIPVAKEIGLSIRCIRNEN